MISEKFNDVAFFLEKLKPALPRLLHLIDQFAGIKVLVIGDLTLDEFLTGQVERISREAPVLILRHQYTRQIPGGGANAIYNLAKLGAQVQAIGIIGQDEQGKALKSIFESAGVEIKGIIEDVDRPTVTKTRIIGHARQSVNQQIVRVDRKKDQIPSLSLQTQLADHIKQALPQVAAVVCSDYGEGVFTPEVIKASLNHPLTIVDTQKGLPRYQNATLFTPNVPEAELAVGYPIQDEESLHLAGKDLLRLTHSQHILITRGEEGMSLFSQTPKGVVIDHIPAFNRTDVFDVTGAGDTVVAALTLSLCAGGTVWESAVLGNLAASIVVREFGTATTTIDQLKDALNLLLEDF